MVTSPTLTACHLSFWAVERADHSGLGESLDAAIAAAEQLDPSDPLTQDLADFVNGYANGAISDADFTYRQKHPHACYDIAPSE